MLRGLKGRRTHGLGAVHFLVLRSEGYPVSCVVLHEGVVSMLCMEGARLHVEKSRDGNGVGFVRSTSEGLRDYIGFSLDCMTASGACW